MTENTDEFGWEDVVAAMQEIRNMARALLYENHNQFSWRPTSLVNEALLRLHGKETKNWTEINWKNKKHFFNACRRAMRSALIDRARYHLAEKRPKLVFMDEILEGLNNQAPEYMADKDPDLYFALNQLIYQISVKHTELSEILEYRFVCGFSVMEIAPLIGRSETHTRRLFAQAIKELKKIIQINN